MSYNIDSIEVLKTTASINFADLRRVVASLSDKEWLPEINFIEDLKEDDPYSTSTTAKLTELSWRGEGSGHSWHEVFLPKIAPLIRGRIEAVVIWEGGDSVSGIIVDDGKVTDCDVEYRLVPKDK